jgi:hypothetical protein
VNVIRKGNRDGRHKPGVKETVPLLRASHRRSTAVTHLKP